MDVHTLFPDWNLFVEMQEQGYVRRQHNGGDLYIYNYTEKAAYEGVWNFVTLTCRGLIINGETWQVVARPFKKFFNYGQDGAANIPLDGPVTAIDKMDGSLGIWYRDEAGNPCIATRGSFKSDQAIEGTTMLCENEWAPKSEEWTPLFEIIYPENRIVCDYGDQRKLVLLGAVHKATGIELGPLQAATALGWFSEVAQQWNNLSFADVLSEPLLTQREGKEGLVIMDMYGHKVKVRQQDYCDLHKIVTGLSRKMVWTWMQGRDKVEAKEGLDSLQQTLPDEFWGWTDEVGSTMLESANRWYMDAKRMHAKLMNLLPEGYTQKDFALQAQESLIVEGRPTKWLPMVYLLEKNLYGKLWHHIWNLHKPTGDSRMFNGGSDD